LHSCLDPEYLGHERSVRLTISFFSVVTDRVRQLTQPPDKMFVDRERRWPAIRALSVLDQHKPNLPPELLAGYLLRLQARELLRQMIHSGVIDRLVVGRVGLRYGRGLTWSVGVSSCDRDWI
jgi:hypothetical protein